MMNPDALVIHGPIGSGKTHLAEQLVLKARDAGWKTVGLLSRRVVRGGETIGYDGLNLETGECFPLVLHERLCTSRDWEKLGEWKFCFSNTGFSKANRTLLDAAERMDTRTLAVADEYGHIELLGRGIHRGASLLASQAARCGLVVLLCRTDKVDRVVSLFPPGVEVQVVAVDDECFLQGVGSIFN